MIGNQINGLTARLTSNVSIKGKVNIGQSSAYPIYDGEYEITPKTTRQVFDTRNKILTDNIGVHEIPYFEQSNIYGDTVYIGTEIEIN